ncbi:MULTISPECIES: metal-dependent hydrolase [Cytobacillus]|uniref:metal-dependent hydrolase n=1 Tax=Cytobacillus TaxID=2675230 RepID=UPI001CD25E5A|nr:metal-dependent hydrolase [Cytobacillus kochii]MCA1025126.1 metal-dependent hydrolase [Cytobacillus kochii]MCM3324169.1 metal-dependent hydrolase [Cytobacillus kochii]MCM3346428.1 metal-dependent hydrolase [Cytobacillus kochii]MDM5206763.1 metal-dependent hydrolase [Cytobacillus kochii]
MDTGTHVVMGLALGGLATLDPVVANSSITAASVMVGTIIGSQIPDIDTILKLKNNASYIRNHRGVTHSIPAVILWPLLITGVIYLFFPETNLFHLWLWTFIAVFLHVFVDIFNAYGTQALRPFSSRWVALGMINTFDPFIFAMHIFGLFLWIFGMDPGYTFLVIYCILFIYYVLRYFAKKSVEAKVQKLIPDATEIIISPTMKYNQWRIAIKNKDSFFVGRALRGQVRIVDQFKRVPIPKTPIFNAATKDKNISAFLSFSPVYRWEIETIENIVEIRFIDLRYRSNEYYPFVAVAHLDKDLTIINSYTGWIFSEEKLKKKLDIITN